MPNRYIENRKRESAISSLKEILVIITGLTITNSVIMLVANGKYEKISTLYEFSFQPLCLFLILLINIIRFYHGNVRLLDDSYLIKEKTYLDTGNETKDDRLNYIHWDFIVILITGILFAFMSFYLHKYADFFSIFTFILIFDVAWYFFTNKDTRDPRIQKQRKYWAFNNIAHLLLFIPIVTIEINNRFSSMSSSDTTTIYNRWSVLLLFILGTTNAIADFYISWPFYFPAKFTETNNDE